MKRTPLTRHVGLRTKRRPVNYADPGRLIWKTSTAGYCQCGQCDRFSLHLHRHHIVTEQTLRTEGREDALYDLRNAILLDSYCHRAHHSALRRVPLSSLPQCALVFAGEVLGVDAAILYLARFYAAETCGEGWRP